MPPNVESYPHRVASTARVGKNCKVSSLVDNGEDKRFFYQILSAYRSNINIKTAMCTIKEN